jgi:hypothetical protein
MTRTVKLSLLLLVFAAACNRDNPTDPRSRPEVGQTLQLNVNAEQTCENPVSRTGRVVAVTQRAVVVADVDNPAGGFTDQDYQAFGTAFDNLVWPVDTRNFGEPADIDGNGRVVIFFTRAVNNLTVKQDEFIGGFFFGRDLFPRRDVQRPRRLTGCAASNEAEMFYMRVPEPGRPNFGLDEVRRGTIATLAHEFQHLINASRRLYVNNAQTIQEEVWLNEALSHIAEELVFYETSGLAPRQNLDINRVRSSQRIVDAFNEHAAANFGRFRRYLQNPQAASLLGKDELPTRGAGWAFLRYAADRKGGSEQQLWFDLVNAQATGVANLRERLSVNPIDWLQDWTMAVYTDDADIPVEQPRFIQPSWHFRSVYAGLQGVGRYPLQTIQLQNGIASSFSLQAGGAAYLRFGVLPGTRAEVRAVQAGAASPTTCTSASNLAVGQVLTGEIASAGTICVDGGAERREFTIVPFFPSEVQSQTVNLQFTALGVAPVLGPPNPSLQLDDAVAALLDGQERALPGTFEQKLRELERRELGPKVLDGGFPVQPQLSASAGAQTTVRISIVRTR